MVLVAAFLNLSYDAITTLRNPAILDVLVRISEVNTIIFSPKAYLIADGGLGSPDRTRALAMDIMAK